MYSPSICSTSSDDLVNCQICFQSSHGNHFGVYSCRACAAFFRRAVVGSYKDIKCRQGDGKCHARMDGRFVCKKCRLDRCFEVGMTADKVQHDRDLISSTQSFVLARKRKMLSSIIPQSLQSFLGRPVFILACEPDLATSDRTYIDVKFLIDHASDLLENTVVKMPDSLKSMSGLHKLSYGLEQSRLPNDEIKLCTKIGKAECLLFWEHEFINCAKFLVYCDEFQQLPKNLKIQFLKSVWYTWIRLEKIAQTADIRKKSGESTKCMVTNEISVDYKDIELDITWFTNYKKEQLSYFLDPMECMFIENVVEPLLELDPSVQELTYMLCILSFRFGGKQMGGEIVNVAEKIIDNLSNDLHNHYILDMKIVNYAGRMTKMLKIVKTVEHDLYERMERAQLARIFDIFVIDFSHPEMFFGYQR